MHVCVRVHVCAHVWGGQRLGQAPSSLAVHLMLGERIPHWTPASLIRLDLLTSSSQGSSCLCLSRVGITGSQGFLMGVRNQTNILMLIKQVFYWLSFLLNPKVLILWKYNPFFVLSLFLLLLLYLGNCFLPNPRSLVFISVFSFWRKTLFFFFSTFTLLCNPFLVKLCLGHKVDARFHSSVCVCHLLKRLSYWIIQHPIKNQLALGGGGVSL